MEEGGREDAAEDEANNSLVDQNHLELSLFGVDNPFWTFLPIISPKWPPSHLPPSNGVQTVFPEIKRTECVIVER